MVKTKPGPDQKLRKEGKAWIAKVAAAEKLEKDWLDDAAKASKAYTNEEKSDDNIELGDRYDFNILFANVETIVPAVINSPPVPDIRRRFNDQDPAARIVADMLERAISVQIDDSRLQVELEATAQDAFLAGRGIVRIKFKADVLGGEPSKKDIAEAAEEADPERYGKDGAVAHGTASDDAPDGDEAPADATPERIENECIMFEAVSWRDYRHGPAKRWEDRTWDAFRFVIPKEDENESFNAGMIDSQFDAVEKKAWSEDENDICGWEIWCKKTRKVKFIDDRGVVLKVIDDPLGLSGFFPIPTPMQPIEITGRLRPVNPFMIYKKLADELDTITKRIEIITKAMKVRGWYSGGAKDLANVLNLDDNEFAPISDGELYANSQGGLAAAIAFWPIDKFIQVLRELYSAREQTKQSIYEITGISDIVRGASKATETLGAQEIKSQWGSLRIQKMQRMIERCARDLFVMMTQIIPTRFSMKTLQEMTGVQLMPTGQETPEKAAEIDAVLALLRRPLSTFYRVNVESDSTVRADLTRQKQEVSQFLTGASAYFAAVAPLVQQGALPAEAAVEIFAATSRMFNLGKSVEDTLEKMVTDAKAQASQQQPGAAGAQPTPEQAAALAKSQADEQAQQIAQQDAANRQSEFEARMNREVQKAALDDKKAQQDIAIGVLSEELKRIELETKRIDQQIKQVELETKTIGLASAGTTLEIAQ